MHPKGAKKNRLAQAIFSKDGPNLTNPEVTKSPKVTPNIYNVIRRNISGVPILKSILQKKVLPKVRQVLNQS